MLVFAVVVSLAIGRLLLGPVPNHRSLCPRDLLSPQPRHGLTRVRIPRPFSQNPNKEQGWPGLISADAAKREKLVFIRRCANALVNSCSAFLIWQPASDEHGKGSFRLVYDYVNLNAVTAILPSVLPRSLDLVRLAVKSRVFQKWTSAQGFTTSACTQTR